MNRDTAMQQFLAESGWKSADLTPLAQDASFRRYFRLSNSYRSAILMDAPPPERPVNDFATIAQHLNRLAEAGAPFAAPDIYAEDTDHGFLLLEDFGDASFTRELAGGRRETELYQLATDALIALHQHPENANIALSPYNHEALQQEAQLLPDWFFSFATGEKPHPTLYPGWFNGWQMVFSHIINRHKNNHQVIVLRDFHIDNAMWLERNGRRVCGLLDFQDALIGSPAYDLVSLLEDARRDVSEPVKKAMIERYCSARNVDQAALMEDYAVLGCQRHCKIAGIFVRLAERDGKTQYLPHLARVIRLIASHLDQPVLAPVRHWFDTHLPLDALSLEPFS